MNNAVSRELALPPDKIEQLHDWRASTVFSDLERAVLEFVELLTATPANVPDELRSRLHAHLNEKQLVDLTNNIAWENARARFNRGFDIRADGFE